MLYVDIESAIDNIASDVEFLQPLYEAIVNSVHSHSTKINIDIDYDKKSNYITSYCVTDNGDGYTHDNITSFSTLWAKIKQEPGALGSGRLMFLRVFEYVEIESYTGLNKINILFDRNFSPASIKPEISNQSKKTITKFFNLLPDYQNTMKFNPNKIKETIFHELLPLFAKILTNKQNLTFTINGEQWIDKQNIAEKFGQMQLSYTNFELTPFNRLITEKFNLFYNINKDAKGKIIQFYGAAGRKVRNFSSSVSIRKLPENASGIFCLTSDYLDVRVKDDRKDFKIAPNESNRTQTHPISFTEINQQLQIKLNEIILENFPNYQKDFETKKQNLMEQYPHLSEYIDEVQNLTYSDEEIIEEAKNRMADSFKKTQKALEDFKIEITTKRDFNEQKFNSIIKTFTKTGRDQLASYIAYRQTILDMMKAIAENTDVDKKIFNEKSIHELFMPKNTTSECYPHLGTNVWILDDKFMSYLYAASDKEIKHIREKFHNELEALKEDVNDADKPDLILFFSDSSEDIQRDVLIIEFKKQDVTFHEKVKAITQLEIYASVIYDTMKNIRSIHTYTIIDIDPKFATYLKRTIKLHENSLGENSEYSSYYSYVPDYKAHINVISFDQVIKDAMKRNKVFLNILRKQHS